MYKRGDFHIHSTASDGDLKPGEVVILAKENFLDIIALTDHNTVSGISEAVKVGKIHGVKVIPGIELSSRYKGSRVHILGYFRGDEYKDIKFLKSLKAIADGRVKEAMAILDYEINLVSEAGRPNLSSAIKFLKYFNCVVVLAHPVFMTRDLFLKIIDCNFDGIEAKYFRNSEKDTEYFVKIAKSKKLIYTAGSDFHTNKKSDKKHGNLGQIYLREKEIKLLLSKL